MTNIHIINNQSDLLIQEKTITSLVRAVLACEQAVFDEVNLHFIENEQMCQLHATYFNDPSPTDCISFPIDDSSEQGYRVLGDVFVCPKTAIQYTKSKGGSPSEEASLYIVHGLLHLLGYDDIADEDRKLMREAEQRSMVSLKKLNLLSGFQKPKESGEEPDHDKPQTKGAFCT